ncbi:MAG: hypothetical protein K2G73_07740 [Eubacterium sp.]|nr:hypothetical protein [Eubacterium sp.]
MKNNPKKELKALYTSISPAPNKNAKEHTIFKAAALVSRLSPAEATMSFGEFFLSQIKFIRKKVWLGQFLALIFCTAVIFTSSDSVNSISLISSLIPLIFIFGVGELSRAFLCKTAEMEMSTPFTLNQVMLSRLTILGLTDILVLTCIIAITAVSFPISIFRILMYICVPFLITSFGCLCILNYVHTKECNYYCIALGVLVMAGSFAVSEIAPSVYEASLISGWFIMFAISLLCTAVEIQLLLKSCTKNTIYKSLNN